MGEQLARIEDYINQQLTADPPSSAPNGQIGSAQELKELVALWSSTVDKVKKMSRIARSLGVLRKDYEAKIVAFMQQNEIEELTTQQSIIQCVSSKPRKATVRAECLGAVLPDPELRGKVVEALSGGQGAGGAGLKLRRLSLV